MVSQPFEEVEVGITVDLPGARALFTTVPAGDIRETGADLAARLGVALRTARQVHGNVVTEALAEVAEVVEADAIVTTLPGLAPMVMTADCVPIVIAGDGAVAAVHAGWKGLRDGVIAAAVERLRGLGAGGELAAAIGPAAGACCYEVGEDLHALFSARGQDLRNGRNLDLQGVARLQLQQVGVAHIMTADVCTICSEAPRLHSYRRDGAAAGRQGALVWLS